MDQAGRAVLDSTRMLIRAVRGQAGLAYADDTWSPLSDITLSLIARRLGTRLTQDDLGDGIQEIGIPGYVGAPVIVVNRAIAPGLRRLALRHGLAHLVAGELEPEQGGDVRFMSSIHDHMTLEERRADLFALADLIPDRQLMELQRSGYERSELERWVTCEILRYASSWPSERMEDRCGLRMALLETSLR